MNRRIVFVGLSALAVAIFGGICVLGFRVLVPINPSYPYFPEYQLVEGGVRWSLGMFQPYYLYSYTKEEIPVIKVVYRDRNGRMVLGDVQMGQKIEGKIFYPSIQIGKNEWTEPTKAEQIGKRYKFGQRVRVTYLANSTRSSEQRYADVVEPAEIGAREFCMEFLYECEAAKTTYLNQVDHRNIQQLHQLPSKSALLGIEISDLLLKGETDYGL